jgi:hypothetical protein
MSEVKVYDWDDEIIDDGEEREFMTLEEGDYDFEVFKFERGHYTPSANAKTPSCNMAIITLKVETDEGDAFITDTFPYASTMEWKASAFLRSIGLKKHGEAVSLKKIAESVGERGRAHITKTEGTKKDGVYFNNVGKYIDPVVKGEKKKKVKGDDVNW